MKDVVLGESYELSVAVVSKEKIRSLNHQYRGKDTPTDILSFPLDDTTGEIYINVDMTKKKAVEFDKTYEDYLAFLFIHGLVHLKGYDHGGTMERIEAKYRRICGVSD
jgi:probable rRNA maturation factor